MPRIARPKCFPCLLVLQMYDKWGYKQPEKMFKVRRQQDVDEIVQEQKKIYVLENHKYEFYLHIKP